MAPGLWIYLVLARRFEGLGGRPAADPAPDATRRPEDGPLVWLRATTPDRDAAVLRLAARLADHREDATILVTAETEPGDPPANLTTAPSPGDGPREMAQFLAAWRPDVVAVSGDLIAPVMLTSAADRGIPVILIDGDLAPHAKRTMRWLPGAQSAAIRSVSDILASTSWLADAYQSMGAPAERIEVTGPLDEGSVAPSCDEAELDAWANDLRGRPLWLAVSVPLSEIDAVAAAHRSASQRAHRLLLVLIPARPEDTDALAQALRDKRFLVARASEALTLTPETQVIIIDEETELGLWYRLAPVTYLGGTLADPDIALDPYGPAALGSAVVHGPHSARHRDAQRRLARAQGSRAVSDPGDLAQAVSELLAPDQAAAIAHRAWQVASSGAGVTDRAIAVIEKHLDEGAP
ncbi:MAG: glycosyltransferase N-terminal domain-containing protein [Pseudomonadota bacterium]